MCEIMVGWRLGHDRVGLYLAHFRNMNMEPASEVGVTKKSRGFEWSKAPIQMRTLVIISARVVLMLMQWRFK